MKSSKPDETEITGTIDRWKAELTAAEEAWRSGNDGRARVCCRRALGAVLAATTHETSPGHKKSTAIERINFFLRREDIPESVRRAAIRITTNVEYRLSPDFTFNPILDSQIIIGFLLADKQK